MYSSQNSNPDILYHLFNSGKSVFRLKDVAMLSGITDFQSLNKKLNYLVQKGKILNPRKGIYAIDDYLPEELACKIFTPSYISLEYVLQKAGIIFQFHLSITAVSYLSRAVTIQERNYSYRKLKNEILTHPAGIEQLSGSVNQAIPERAFLDMLYLHKEYHFDHLDPLELEKVYTMAELYQSKALEKRLKKTLPYD